MGFEKNQDPSKVEKNGIQTLGNKGKLFFLMEGTEENNHMEGLYIRQQLRKEFSIWRFYLSYWLGSSHLLCIKTELMSKMFEKSRKWLKLSFIHRTKFFECLLCIGYYRRPWGYSSEKKKKKDNVPCAHDLYILVGNLSNKQVNKYGNFTLWYDNEGN